MSLAIQSETTGAVERAIQPEFAYLLKAGVPPACAALAAARAAALSLQADKPAALPDWVPVMAGDIAPTTATLAQLAATLPGGPATPADIALIRAVWSQLGTPESLMETGGDIRLATDPVSALNGYGCSHRPRPWAITFASSTASSSSERGYAAADKIRLRTTAALLKHHKRRPIARALSQVRTGIAGIFGLDAGHKIILAASGTDTELLALAMTHLATPSQPILNILIAPEETGRGVPMAARGLHFAVDTALGHNVAFEAPITGFRPDTTLATIALRLPDGALRDAAEVESEIAATIATGLASGQRVILHVLDLSKTGLLAPSPAFLGPLRARHGNKFDIVVDACQTRLSAGSIKTYLALDAMVLITGSKFFTGPPFAGASILPPAIADRLNHATLPAGLDAYFGRDEFPESCPAAEHLPAIGNYGLALRWHAALAEMRAFKRVATARQAAIIDGFGETVRTAIAARPVLSLLPQPPITRSATDTAWERMPSIFTFSIAAPHAPQRNLTAAEARTLYLWLNADLAHLLPDAAAIAGRICHIGQPVTLPQPAGEGAQGVLRISAGARLISGEPSHAALGAKARIAREFADLAMVFAKIDLLLANWPLLSAANPQPCYKPGNIPATPHSLLDSSAGLVPL